MLRSYEYNGFRLEVSVESDVNIRPDRRMPTQVGSVRISVFKAGEVITRKAERIDLRKG